MGEESDTVEYVAITLALIVGIIVGGTMGLILAPYESCETPEYAEFESGVILWQASYSDGNSTILKVYEQYVDGNRLLFVDYNNVKTLFAINSMTKTSDIELIGTKKYECPPDYNKIDKYTEVLGNPFVPLQDESYISALMQKGHSCIIDQNTSLIYCAEKIQIKEGYSCIKGG